MADLRTRFNRAAMAGSTVQQAAGRGDRNPSGIPRPLTRILGRDNEILSASEMLLAGNAPLVTLTGPGGVGKTRLAQEIGLASSPCSRRRRSSSTALHGAVSPSTTMAVGRMGAHGEAPVRAGEAWWRAVAALRNRLMNNPG